MQLLAIHFWKIIEPHIPFCETIQHRFCKLHFWSLVGTAAIPSVAQPGFSYTSAICTTTEPWNMHWLDEDPESSVNQKSRDPSQTREFFDLWIPTACHAEEWSKEASWRATNWSLGRGWSKHWIGIRLGIEDDFRVISQRARGKWWIYVNFTVFLPPELEKGEQPQDPINPKNPMNLSKVKP